MAKLVINPNELGDLVPKCTHEDSWPLRNMGPKYQEQLREICHRTAAVRNRWKCDWLPLFVHDRATETSDNVAAFEKAAHVCAVHLSGGNVGVLRMDGRTGDCALFLRLKRADWFAWADKHKVPRSRQCAFTKRMDHELGKKMLMDARAFKLGLLSVHHPSVLALLCTMSRHNWLRLVDDRVFPEVATLQKMGSFTLVALPPLPAEFEQCLGLLGHSAAFVKDNAGSDDDEVSLSTRSDAKPTDQAWGTISAGDKVVGSLAHLFEEGAAIMHQLANPSLFAHGLAEFNGAALSHGRFLDKIQRGAKAGPLPPLKPGDEASYLDPSDDDEPAAAAALAAAAPAAAPAPAPAPAAAPAPALAPAPKSKPVASKPKPKAARDAGSTSRAAPNKRKRGSDSDEFSDSDEDASQSLSDTSEEEEEDGSSSSSSDDDDNDNGGGGGGGGGGANTGPAPRASVHVAATTTGASVSSDSDSPSPTASRKRARTEPAPAVPDVNGDQALQSVLAEMAKPFCERVERLCNGRGTAMFSQHNRLKADMHLLQQARTPVAFCAAMISIGNTLSDLQAERFSSSCFVLVNREEAHRLRGLAAQTSQFADAVHSALSGPGGLGSAVEE